MRCAGHKLLDGAAACRIVISTDLLMKSGDASIPPTILWRFQNRLLPARVKCTWSNLMPITPVFATETTVSDVMRLRT